MSLIAIVCLENGVLIIKLSSASNCMFSKAIFVK